MINTKDKNKYKTLTPEQLNEVFINSCQKGHLEIVQYLLTSADLKEHANIHADNDLGFRLACENGYLELVKYLLTSPDLKEHADIHADNDYGFRLACARGQLEVVKYLLTSPNLKEHADIHANNDSGFRLTCNYEQLEIVKFLIIDMNIEKTNYIEKYLTEKTDNKTVQQAIELFNTRDLHHQLNENIKDNKEKVKKVKI